MSLPTTRCPCCRSEVLVYRDVAPDADPETAPLHSFCCDCDAQLDRFGRVPVLLGRDLEQLAAVGYRVHGDPAVSCRQTRGCEGCDKIESRPW